MNVFGDLKKLIKKPTTKKIEIDNPVKLFKNLYYNYKDTFLLESMESDSGLARYSIIGFNPVAKIKAHDHNVTITTDTYTFEYTSDNPLLDIKALIKNDFKEEGFRGGLLGYVSYDSFIYFDNVPSLISIYPDFEFGLFLDCVVYDNIHKTCEYTTLNEDRSDLIKRIYQEEHTNGILEYKLIQEDFTQDEYENAVDETKNLITDGEIFQAVISNSENLVLKGGLFIYSLTDFDSRVTVDVDFLLRKIPNTPEQLRVILEKIIEVDTGNDIVTFEINDIAPIAVAKKYAGIGASIIARIKNTKTP